MATAQSEDERVEDTSQTDAFTKVFAEPDGSWTSETAPEPVRAMDETGEWAAIDLELEEVDGRLVPKNALGGTSFSSGGDKDLAQVDASAANPGSESVGSAGTLKWRWPTDLPAPSIDGATAVYEDVIPGGGDLVVIATATGFTHNIVLNRAPGAAATSEPDAGGETPTPDPPLTPAVEYVIPVVTPGAELEEGPGGSLEIVDNKTGDAVAAAPAPLMWDSSGDPNATGTGTSEDVEGPEDPAVAPVNAAVVDTTAGGRLVLSPDMDFLTDPDTVYPVTIDPTFSAISNGDTWIMEDAYTTSQSSSIELRAGTYNSGANKARTFLKFSDEERWNGKHIRAAALGMRNFSSTSCEAGAIRASRITESWSTAGITWANQPLVTYTNAGQYSAAHGFDSSCPQATSSFSITDIVQGWANGTPNYGLRLSAVTETNNNSWRRYRATEYQAYDPYIAVTYNSFPDKATGLRVEPATGSATYTNSLTPTLSATVTDPDKSQVAGYFEIWRGTALEWSGKSANVPSGGTATIKIPSGELANGETYTLKTWGQDSFDKRSKTVATKSFTVDTTKPAVVITSNRFTNGTWTTSLPSDATTTLFGSTDTSTFLLDYDGVKAVAPADASGDATLPYTPTNGWHVFEVTPVDKSGNYGNPVTFSYGAGDPTMNSPAAWTPSVESFPVDASAPPDATTGSLQWRLASEASWRTADAVKKPDGAAWEGEMTGGASRSTTGPLVWSATEEAYETGTLTGPALIEMWVCFNYPSQSVVCTAPRLVSLYASGYDAGFPVTNLGPASVALLNGEASISETDAGDSTAGLGRSFASLSDTTLPTGDGGAFGPGWSDPVILSADDSSSVNIIDNRALDGTVIVIDRAGGSEAFQASGGGDTYRPVHPTGDDTKLTFIAGTGGGPDRLVLSRPLGTAITTSTWELKSSDTDPSAPPAWVFTSTDAPGTASDTAVSSTGQRPTWIRESDPAASSTCTQTTQTVGCRGLRINYTGSGETTRVGSVERIIGAATQGDVKAKIIASYTYASGKLTKVCSGVPSSGGSPLCSSYTYTTVASRTMVATLTPPGRTPWRFTYDGLGRMTEARRAHPSGSGQSGDAVWSIDYSLATTASGLPDMSTARVAEWGQTTVPSKVYAVYTPQTGTADISKAQLFYTDWQGRVTNTASQGPAGWVIDNTSWSDSHGNITQTLDAAGWSRVQAAPAADRPRVALEASSLAVYNTWGTSGADGTVGTRVTDEYGPARTARLDSGVTGMFRTHVQTIYDDDPNVEASLISSRPGTYGPGEGLGLPVKVVISAASADMTSDFDRQVAVNGYAPNVAGDGNGWVLGKPTSTSSRISGTASTPEAGGVWSKNVTRFTNDGQVTETREPGGAADGTGAGSDARSTRITYYSPTGSGDCGGKPAWSGLPCKVEPTAQPAGVAWPTIWHSAYTQDLQPSQVKDLKPDGTLLRTITSTYDDLGREKAKVVATAATDGVTADSISTTYGFDPSTGLSTTVSGGGQTITTGYDSWGRKTTYTDASGMTATTSFDAAGRVATASEGGATTTYAYDARGFIDNVTIDGGGGTFGYTWAANGDLAQIDYPNGLSSDYVTDELGTLTGIRYLDGSNEIFAFTAMKDVGGRTVEQTSPESAQNFSFDGLGRLQTVEDNSAGACDTRSYDFSASSHRTGLTKYGPGVDGACQNEAPTSSWTATYDSVGRITTSGYSYDALGRALTAPAADTTPGAATAISMSYRADDTIASLNQEVVTAASVAENRAVTYQLDSAGRIAALTKKTNGAETERLRYRFADDSDSPSSVESSTDAGTTWTTTRYHTIHGSGLVVEVNSGTTTYHLPNPHGDLVATSPGTGGVSAYGETDEYGVVSGEGTPNRYGWLGSHQRSNDALGGLILMGARLYNPRTGLFASTDAVAGGNRTTYGYPEDPVNNADTNGMWSYTYRYDLGNTQRTAAGFFTQLRRNFTSLFPIRGARALTLGAKMDLRPSAPGPFDLYFPVVVKSLWNRGWIFGVRALHPDYPGSTIKFSFYNFRSQESGDGIPNVYMVVHGQVSMKSLGGACLFNPVCYAAYISQARSIWAQFASKLRKPCYLRYRYCI